MKRLFIFIVCSITVSALSAQSPTENLKKYWFYRYRLINDFMKIGTDMGESIPAKYRRIEGAIDNPTEEKLKWSDSGIILGQYIGVLATEYKLLKDNEQSTYQTRKELYYALEAFNRLDETAESYYRGYNWPSDPLPPGPNNISPDLNGYFMKDDVTQFDSVSDTIYTKDFVDINKDHFNSNPNSRVEVTHVKSSGFDDVYRKNRRPPSSESHDQVWEIMQGCALIVKCVDANANFNNLSFRDGETKIRAEAIAIVDRMITWMNKDGDWAIKNPVTTDCDIGITYDCSGDQDEVTYDPNNGFSTTGGSWDYNDCAYDVKCGTGAWTLYFGASKAAEEITGRDNRERK